MSGSAIPASAIVSVIPSVISAGGNALDLNGLLLTRNTRVPIGSVVSFSSQADVASYFGATSTEANAASNYFLGFDNSNAKPGAMLFFQYNSTAVRAYMRGGALTAANLAQLITLTGTISITIDGVVRTSSSVNLTSATSFSDVAELVTVGLNLAGPAQASVTAAISGTTMTVSAVASGTLAVGQEVRGVGVTAGTLITALGTGVGGTGTYTVGISQTVGSSALTTNTPLITFDSVSQAFLVQSPTTGASSTMGYATGLLGPQMKLNAIQGAVLSQGAAATSPSAAMNTIVSQTQNWATFTTAFDPDASGFAQKQLFADWVNAQNSRYLYIPFDTDVSPTQSNNATSSFGAALKNANYTGVELVWASSTLVGIALCSFQMGAIASIDFTQTDGRATMAFRSQTGIAADVVNQTVADNLIANGYNFYGEYATADDQFIFFYPGSMIGPYLWVDSYINQIWLNNQFQLALMVLLVQMKSIPYNQQGYTLIKAALQDPINQGLNFGAFRAGVTLSNAQAAEVNIAAGVKISDTLSTQGWYLQVKDAIPQVRAARGSPPCTFWYMDGQSVQKINLGSVNVQ